MASYAKELMMQEVAREFDSATCAFISNFNGLSVADLSDFRRAVEKVAKRSLVVKHSIARKVFAGHSWSDAEKFLKGQVMVTFGTKEPQAISKVLVDYAKAHEKFVLAGMMMEDRVYGQEFVKRLASLPSRHELLTQVAVRVQSPISGFVITLSQIMRGLVCALNEIKKKKEPQAA